jgi:hypothetical protein
MVETAIGRHRAVERALARVAERRVSEIVGERKRLGEVLIEAETARQRARNLRDLQRVRQARAIVVALMLHKHLRLVLESADRSGVNQTIAVATEIVAARTRLLRQEAAPGKRRVCGIRRSGAVGGDGHARAPI